MYGGLTVGTCFFSRSAVGCCCLLFHTGYDCFQVGKEMLSIKNKEGEGPSFNLLMELLRGDH